MVGGPHFGHDAQPFTWNPASMPIQYRVDPGPMAAAPGNATIIDNAAGLQRLQNMQLKNPILVGFGIKDRLTFQSACKYANGAIIGTAYIKALEHATDVNEATKQFLGSILQ